MSSAPASHAGAGGPWLALLLVALACCGASGPTALDGGRPDAGVGPAPCAPDDTPGYEEGDVLLDLHLPGCDGRPVALHDLCGAPASLLVHFFGWCPPCYDLLEMVNRLALDHGQSGLRRVVVVAETPAGHRADAAYCQALQARYQVDATMVYDPEGRFEAYGTTDLVLVVDGEGRIRFKRQGPSAQEVERAVQEELARDSR